MQLYLDTGDLGEIKTIAEMGLLNGVTTNPTLIAKEKVNFRDELKSILKVMKANCPDDFTLSAEVIAADPLNDIAILKRNITSQLSIDWSRKQRRSH